MRMRLLKGDISQKLIFSLFIYIFAISPIQQFYFIEFTPPAFDNSNIRKPNLDYDFPIQNYSVPTNFTNRTLSDNYILKATFSNLFYGFDAQALVTIENRNTTYYSPVSHDMFFLWFTIEIRNFSATNYTVNTLVKRGETKSLGLFSFRVPQTVGFIYYRFVYQYYLKDWYENSWYKHPPVSEPWHPLEVFSALKSKENYPEVKNPDNYYNLVNELIKPNTYIQDISKNIRASYPGDFNIYQILTVYEYVANVINYTLDPVDRDEWTAPATALRERKGDCDEFALAFSSLIFALGGTTRIILTSTHAFSVIYIGNTMDDFNKAVSAINKYYNVKFVKSANYRPTYFQDELGYWLTADPTSEVNSTTLNLFGRLPTGGAPIENQNSTLYSEGWYFQNNQVMLVIDVTGKTYTSWRIYAYIIAVVLFVSAVIIIIMLIKRKRKM